MKPLRLFFEHNTLMLLEDRYSFDGEKKTIVLFLSANEKFQWALFKDIMGLN